MTGNKALLLVVDDDEDIRELLKVLLEAEGYQVTTAADGVDALRRLRESERPSLILLDLMMPEMDGKKFIEALRASPLAKIPVVVMSGNKEAGKGIRELKYNGYLTKPVELHDLLAAIQQFLPYPAKPAA